MTPFAMHEIDNPRLLWCRGGFPKSWLRDILSQTRRRFWTMLAHYYGQIFNVPEIGRSINISYKTSDRYLDILTGTFMIRRLSPRFENLSKRQIRSPKIYFRDSGI